MTPPLGGLERTVKRCVGRPAFWVLFVAVLAGAPLASGLRRMPLPRLPVLARVPDFTLDRSPAGSLDRASLLGYVWVAHVLDPNCAPCLASLETMRTLQRRTRNVGPALRLVTFVRGKTPWVPDGRASALTWFFANGPGVDPWVDAAARSLRSDPRALRSGGELLLVDAEGRVRGTYATGSDVQPLLGDIAVLLNQPIKHARGLQNANSFQLTQTGTKNLYPLPTKSREFHKSCCKRPQARA